MPASRLRLADRSDIPALMTIRSAVRENVLSDPAKVPAGAYCPFIDGRGLWLWEEAGRILGFAAADPANGSVWALFVDPAEEGRGIGRALLSSVLSDLRRAGWARARLSTQPGSRAERFYRRAGWLDAGIAADGDLILETAL